MNETTHFKRHDGDEKGVNSRKGSSALPVEAQMGPEKCKRLRLPGFLDNRHMKAARLSALNTGRSSEC
jgi:hypothetical protein